MKKKIPYTFETFPKDRPVWIDDGSGSLSHVFKIHKTCVDVTFGYRTYEQLLNDYDIGQEIEVECIDCEDNILSIETETAIKMKVMEAFVKGKKIQSKSKLCDDGYWNDNSTPSWDWSKYDYRVNPGPKAVPKERKQTPSQELVPWTDETLPKEKFYIQLKYNEQGNYDRKYHKLMSWETARKIIGTRFFTYKRLLEEFDWIPKNRLDDLHNSNNWNPCGTYEDVDEYEDF